jgi:CBS domain-containing protein
MDTARALDVLRSRTLAAVPVVHNGQLVGLVTEHQFMAIAGRSWSRARGRMPSS